MSIDIKLILKKYIFLKNVFLKNIFFTVNPNVPLLELNFNV